MNEYIKIHHSFPLIGEAYRILAVEDTLQDYLLGLPFWSVAVGNATILMLLSVSFPKPNTVQASFPFNPMGLAVADNPSVPH